MGRAGFSADFLPSTESCKGITVSDILQIFNHLLQVYKFSTCWEWLSFCRFSCETQTLSIFWLAECFQRLPKCRQLCMCWDRAKASAFSVKYRPLYEGLKSYKVSCKVFRFSWFYDLYKILINLYHKVAFSLMFYRNGNHCGISTGSHVFGWLVLK